MTDTNSDVISKLLLNVFEAEPKLAQLPQKKVVEYFKVLHTYAPSLAAQPIPAAHWLQRHIAFGNIDPLSIKHLVETQLAINELEKSKASLP